MDVDVDVIDPVIVAALVNGNDTVIVIGLPGRTGSTREALRRCGLAAVHGCDQDHGVVPVHERGHDHGVDHVHVHVHDYVEEQVLLAAAATPRLRAHREALIDPRGRAW